MTNKILIPVEDVDFSLQIVSHIRRFFDPAFTTLLLLRIEPMPKLIEVQRPRGEDIHIYIDQQADDLRARFNSQMIPLAQSLESAGYEVAVQVKFGEAAQEIEEAIPREDIHMVAMTTHGRSGLDRLIHGSVAEHVLRNTNVPVLLLHPVDT